MDEEQLLPPDEPEEPESHAPKEEIRIVDMSGADGEPVDRVCRVCGLLKPVYVEVESQGIVEYTCKECFQKDVAPPTKTCRECSAPVKQDDAFCGKCGKPTELRCGECGSTAKEGDAFCGKCGSTL